MRRRHRATQTIVDRSYLESLRALERLYELSGRGESSARVGKCESSVPSPGVVSETPHLDRLLEELRTS